MKDPEGQANFHGMRCERQPAELPIKSSQPPGPSLKATPTDTHPRHRQRFGCPSWDDELGCGCASEGCEEELSESFLAKEEANQPDGEP